jgi:hypothetical protein
VSPYHLRIADLLLIVEATTAGLAFGSVLCWASVCLEAVFRPQELPMLYWSGIPWLRTDTFGFVAFISSAVFLATTKYLRFWRQYSGGQRSEIARSTTAMARASDSKTVLIFLAAFETITILATGLVGYLSLNAVTHPVTLQMPATHLLPWPTEGALRIMALLSCVLSVATIRCLRVQVSHTVKLTSDTERRLGCSNLDLS